MQVTIYHNPRCSKSRQALDILHEYDIQPEIIDYLSTPPTVAQLKYILRLLNCPARALLRRKEQLYLDMGLNNPSLSDIDIINTMREYPMLIERPIIVVDQRFAFVARPPEKILEYLS